MFVKGMRSFLTILNSDALLFLAIRLAGIILSITSVILLCRAITMQHYFSTDGLGLLYNMLPMGPLAYSLVWSIVSLILPGCQRKYHPILDVCFDFFGWALSFAAAGALLSWSFKDAYEVDICMDKAAASDCYDAGSDLSGTEKSGAILLLLTGITHFIMFIRACNAVHSRRKQYVPSRNSFMQLEKGTDRKLDVVALDVNASNSTAIGQQQL